MPLVLRLSDPDAEFFCLGCGDGFREAVETCTCGFGTPTTRTRVLSYLERSVPTGSLDRPVGSLLATSSEFAAGDIATLRELLRANGTPFLVADAGGQMVPPDDASAVVLYAPLDVMEPVVRRHRFGQTVVPAGDAEPSVLLAEFGSPGEAELAAGRLEVAGIRYEIEHIAPQFALTVGAIGQTHIRVEESDLERARDAIALTEENDVARTWSKDDEDGMVDARRRRRFLVARVLLYMLATGYALVAPFAYVVAAWEGVACAATAVVLVMLAAWSRRSPRRAFLGAFLAVAAANVWGMLAARPSFVLGGLLTMLATFYAFHSAVEAQSPQAED